MGKMIITVSSEIRISPEWIEQMGKTESHTKIFENMERDMEENLKDFGEVLDLTTDLGEHQILKTSFTIKGAPELITQFEKWDHLEMIRMIERDLRLTLGAYGEIIDYRNHYDYEPDPKTFKNPFRSFMFFD